MKERRYDTLVTICVWMLRIAMLVLAVALPAVFYVHRFILNSIIGVDMKQPQYYLVYQIVYNEVLLGLLLGMFLNFREKKIFVKANARCLKVMGYLIIIKDFLYAYLALSMQYGFSLNLNCYGWMIGLILIVFSRLLLYGIRLKDEQQYTV